MSAAPIDSDLPLRGADPVAAYRRYWRRYVVFTGRASRAEYWWPVLANTVLAILLSTIAAVFGGVGAAMRAEGVALSILPIALGALVWFALGLVSLAQVVPSLSVAVRRLHDADLSGLLVLLVLVPFVGGLIVLVLTLLPPSPLGRRFDRGATAWSPIALPVQPVAAPAQSARWPSPEAPTAPISLQKSVAAAPPSGARAAWEQVGAVETVTAPLSAPPFWRNQQYLLVDRSDGIGVLATDGFGVAEGSAALGPGAEVYLPSTALAGPSSDTGAWQLGIVAAVAQRVRLSGMHLPAEIERYGALSMSVTAPGAPVDLVAPDGAVGVLLGVPLPGVPFSVVTTAGELRLIGLTVLRPGELLRIVEGGGAARAAIAAALTALPPAELASVDRLEV